MPLKGIIHNSHGLIIEKKQLKKLSPGTKDSTLTAYKIFNRLKY